MCLRANYESHLMMATDRSFSASAYSCVVAHLLNSADLRRLFHDVLDPIVIGLMIRKKEGTPNGLNRYIKILVEPDTFMNLTMHVKRGDKFLPDVSLSELEQMHGNEPHGKTKTMLHVAIRRKKGDILDTISKAVGIATSTIHDWLSRLEEGGLERRHDYKSPGRPCRLSEAQKKSLDKDIDQDPTKSGFSRGTWTARLVARHILNMFGIRYGDSGALRLTRRMNFSVRGVRPVPYNSATVGELVEYVQDTIRQAKERDGNGYKIVFVDFAGFADSPASRRGIRRRGGRDTVRTNCSKKTVKVAGALGKGTLDVQFHESANTESAVALLEYLRRRYGKVYAIMDNAGAHTSRAMETYIESTKGDVVRRFLPPRTPQHNSIEVEWRELKRALSATFFGGFDKLQKRIIRLLRSGEVAIVKMIDYVFEAIGPQKGPWPKARRMPVEPPSCTA